MEGDESAEIQFEKLVCEPRKVRWVWLVYALLYAVAIPWYWPADFPSPLIGGFPLWVVVSLTSTLVLAGWTVWIIFRYWQAEGEED